LLLLTRASVPTMGECEPPIAPDDAQGDDVRLIARISAGDDLALSCAYDRYAGLVYGLARRVTGSAAMAEELTQEVFVFLWQHPGRFDASRGTLRAFLGAVTHRRAVDRVRSEARRTAREDRVAADPAIGCARAGSDDVTGRVEATELARRVREAVAMLPPDQRIAIELAYFGGCTFRDVAVRLGIPEGTAKSRLRLALARLSSALGPEVALT
jgi:RNA polymerase sigma-70 factor, ECF subfamily